MIKGRFHKIVLTAGLLLVLVSLLTSRYFTLSLSDLAGRAGESVERKMELCRENAKALWGENNLSGKLYEYTGFYSRENIGTYLFIHDTLVFWNNSRIPFTPVNIWRHKKMFPAESGIARLDHGYYLYSKTGDENKTAITLCLLKPYYEVRNNYLKNDFLAWTGIPTGIEIHLDDTVGDKVQANGQYLFSLLGNEPLYYDKDVGYTCFFIFLLGLFVVMLAGLIRIKTGIGIVGFACWIIIPIAVRLLMIWLKWPSFFYHTDLYDVQLFGNANSFLNAYLGDILLNSLLLFFLAAAFYIFARQQTNRAWMQIAFACVLLFALVNQFSSNVVSLVTNSTLSFNFLGIFNIDLSVFIALTALAVYSLAIMVTVAGMADLFPENLFRKLLLSVACLAGVCILQLFISGSHSVFENFWPLFFTPVVFVLSGKGSAKLSLALGFQIVIISVVSSRFLNTYIDKNQKKDLEILSFTLSEKQDAILESEFAGIAERIEKDDNLKFLLDILPSSQEEVQQLIRQKHLGGYFDRYNVDFSLFDKNCNPLLPVRQGVLSNEGYFEDMIRYNSDSTSVTGLFFVKNYKKNSQYIGRISLKEKRLFLLMEPKQFEELGSFPDLLLDQSQQKHEKLKNISHAVYRSGQTTSRYGEVNYPFFYQDSLALSRSEPGHVHHYFHPDEDTAIIISENVKGWSELFTFNSYLLLFFSLITYLFYLCYALVFTSQFRTSSLTRRIQAIIIALLLFAMSAVGITSGRLVSGQFRVENKKELEEKSRVIINELSTQFKSYQLFEPTQKELINFKLKEYARLFNTPISLFDKNGYLYVTSEPKLYEFGLAAPLANPVAFNNLGTNQSSSESVNEKAGTLRYLSFYTALFDTNKKLTGFVNLPYFARQSDLANELSGIISALINVYVILFVLSILAGLILSGYITQPLRLIKQQIANITLGKQNEKINWQSNDEIGRLVAEYNQMLVKLENSANLLAQSERESAWREMAKQVAHEIKNPLTPMKLNLQYLLHVLKNEPGDFREKFEKTSHGIIEQIDSLASIANEFSNFARLPGTQLEAINLVEIINTSALIFESQENIVIKNNLPEKEVLVKGDRDQCLRVFNNIFKNALQALDEVRYPLIEIGLQREEKYVVVSISDNGCGIDETLKPKIFTPNFTTKTTGSGLGLAMVKNIMQGFEGDIWFESEKGKGAVFYLRFLSETGTSGQ